MNYSGFGSVLAPMLVVPVGRVVVAIAVAVGVAAATEAIRNIVLDKQLYVHSVLFITLALTMSKAIP